MFTYIIRIILTLCVLILAGCASAEYFSHSKKGFEDAPETRISIQEAMVLAAPYLDRTFDLRSEATKRNLNIEPWVWVSLKGGWYYFVKDNYPSYTPGFYLKHAVKVNAETGEIIEPD